MLLQETEQDLRIQTDGLIAENERVTAENRNTKAQLRQLQQDNGNL